VRKLITTALICLSVAGAAGASALADPPSSIDNSTKHAASVNNTNANPNACWGQDRSFYASENFFDGNMDIKQSFSRAGGTVAEQKAAWVAEFCGAHGAAE